VSSAVSTETSVEVAADPSTPARVGRDVPYRIFTIALLVVCGAIVVFFAYSIIDASIPGWQVVKGEFFTSTNWDPLDGHFGALALIVGTILTTLLACLIAVPIGVGAALAITYLVPRRVRTITSSLVELLAIVPSIIYGLWGLLVLEPYLVNTLGPKLQSWSHNTFPFNGRAEGGGFGLGSVVLAVMILPTVTAISKDVFSAIPVDLTEAGRALGASRGQVLRKVVLPSSKTGVLGAVTLAAGRALGETVALFILLGGGSKIPSNFFSITATLATQIATDFGELTYPHAFNVICCLAVTLMVIVALVNLSARAIVQRNLRRLQ
jgi:phosphate transport system permease protein